MVDMRVITAPESLDRQPIETAIFLAGSIEMGTAENWQLKVINLIRKIPNNKNIVVYNPRRRDWDNSWKQSIKNPKFKEQVEWELDAIGDADFILMYFDPNTKSPITLLELGLNVHKWYRFFVCCPEGFWKKGNVDIVCEKYNIKQVDTIKELVEKSIG